MRVPIRLQSRLPIPALQLVHLVLALIVAALAAGCSSSDGPPRGAERAMATAPRPAPPRARAPRLFVGAGRGGLAVVDADRGAVLQRLDALEVDDVVVDRARGQVLTFERPDMDPESGALVARRLQPDGVGGWLAGPRTLRRLDGRARHLTITAGVIVFEESYGTRLRLLGDDGAATLGLPAPLPNAAWTDEGGATASALVRDEEGAWALATIAAARGAVAIERAPLAPLSDPSARAVRLGGAVILLDVVEGRLALRAPDAQGRSRARSGAGSAATIDGLVDACALGARRVAVLTTTPRLLALELGDDGAPRPLGDLAIGGARLPIAAAPPRRLLCVADDRLLVATEEAVLAFDLEGGPTGAHLVRDGSFAAEGVRAPIDGPLP